MLPLAKEYASIQQVEELDIDEALSYRDAHSARNEFEEYFYWLSDRNREKEKENQPAQSSPKKRGKFDPIYDPKHIMRAKAPERDKKKVEAAMQSAGTYLDFMRKRGYMN